MTILSNTQSISTEFVQDHCQNCGTPVTDDFACSVECAEELSKFDDIQAIEVETVSDHCQNCGTPVTDNYVCSDECSELLAERLC